MRVARLKMLPGMISNSFVRIAAGPNRKFPLALCQTAHFGERVKAAGRRGEFIFAAQGRHGKAGFRAYTAGSRPTCDA